MDNGLEKQLKEIQDLEKRAYEFGYQNGYKDGVRDCGFNEKKDRAEEAMVNDLKWQREQEEKPGREFNDISEDLA